MRELWSLRPDISGYNDASPETSGGTGIVCGTSSEHGLACGTYHRQHKIYFFFQLHRLYTFLL